MPLQIATKLFIALAISATNSVSASTTVTAPDFPGVRWGFTTVNFLPHVPVTAASSKAPIDFEHNPLAFRDVLGLLAPHGAPPVVLEFAPAGDDAAVGRHTRRLSLENIVGEGLLAR